ncbi:hypothetical protein E3O55_08385 [Cryobacterium sp. MDB1-18-2]|uniref:VVA0879 family protein n=1 Tax=unclassified Cryobacterium TaxID=2649013 RepID=UPI00106903C6|nr:MULTISPECIES: VVA0879 family protein [unclassified Cryobacterium]TFC30094.1 hypothetical protein E3O55_08385 [Cryobacterium sp. MDB1-18-2]TFC41374.1 hypothetical protein E3O50_09825 [Cryobacterium sp. MDB1-18-1]
MSASVKRTQDELLAKLKLRFGDAPAGWSFICPSCKDIASVVRAALDSAGRQEEHSTAHLGQVCIGRIIGALDKTRAGKWEGRGCDWAAFGLFHGPDFIIMPDGHEAPCFAIAPATIETVPA